MIPDLEQEMKKKLADALPGDVVDGFDTEREWAQLSQRMRPVRKTMPLRVWAYAAALLLLVGGVWLMRERYEQRIAVEHTASAREEWAAEFRAEVDKERMLADTNVASTVAAAVPEKTADEPGDKKVVMRRTTRETVRNGTPCPLEISISQIMKCPNARPAAISTCNTLEPGQSTQLNYKASESIASNCSLTVKEIEIRSVATGEIILLDESSTITAQEVFGYLSGEKQGDIYAGIFNSDCNNRNRRHNVRLGNKEGNITIQ